MSLTLLWVLAYSESPLGFRPEFEMSLSPWLDSDSFVQAVSEESVLVDLGLPQWVDLACLQFGMGLWARWEMAERPPWQVQIAQSDRPVYPKEALKTSPVSCCPKTVPRGYSTQLGRWSLQFGEGIPVQP